MKPTYNDIVTENQALKKENAQLKKMLDDERIITDAIAARFGVSATPIRNDFARVYSTSARQQGECKVISMNHLNS